jgi:hypothetical protein
MISILCLSISIAALVFAAGLAKQQTCAPCRTTRSSTKRM